MTKSFTGRKRIRKNFGRIAEVAPMPNLIEVQKSSYDHFLQMGVTADQRDERRPAGSLQVGVPDQGFLRARRSSSSCKLRAGGAEIRRRGMPAARHDLRRAAEGDAAPGRVGRRRGDRRALDPRHQGAGRLHGRHAAHDDERHLHHQRHRAGHRLADAPLARRVLRPRQGQDPFLGQVSVRRPRHSLSRLLARFRVRRQGPRLCAHRPPPQAAGDDAAAGALEQGQREEAAPTRKDRAKTMRRDAAACRSEEILDYFYEKVVFTRDQEGLEDPVRSERARRA